MVTEPTKKLIENYLTLTIWFLIHQDDGGISSEQFKAILQEIGSVEDDLRNSGVSQLAIQRLNGYSEQLYKTPIDQLSPNSQLRICKITFGEGIDWAEHLEGVTDNDKSIQD